MKPSGTVKGGEELIEMGSCDGDTVHKSVAGKEPEGSREKKSGPFDPFWHGDREKRKE